MNQELEKLKKQATEAIQKAASTATLTELDVRYLGRKGELTNMLRTLKDLPENERKKAGQALNAAKNELEQAFAHKRATLEKTALEASLKQEFFDITLRRIPDDEEMKPIVEKFERKKQQLTLGDIATVRQRGHSD